MEIIRALSADEVTFFIPVYIYFHALAALLLLSARIVNVGVSGRAGC